MPEAFRRYVTGRESRELIAAECRRTEMLIGELLGAVKERERTDLSPASDSHRGIPREDRHRFRLLAEHATTVEEAVCAAAIGAAS